MIDDKSDIHWEMAIVQEDGSTISQESFETLKKALKALSENPDDSAFIDKWRDCTSLGCTITKDDLTFL